MRSIRIVGTSPSPKDWTIFDADGKDISGDVLDIKLHVERASLATVELTFFAHGDIVAKFVSEQEKAEWKLKKLSTGLQDDLEEEWKEFHS